MMLMEFSSVLDLVRQAWAKQQLAVPPAAIVLFGRLFWAV
jgi:hypothetical protein